MMPGADKTLNTVTWSLLEGSCHVSLYASLRPHVDTSVTRILAVLFSDSVTNCSTFHLKGAIVFKSRKRKENMGTVAHGTFFTLFLLFCPGRSWQTRENVMLILLHKEWDISFFSHYSLWFQQTTQHKVTPGKVHKAQRVVSGRRIFCGWCHVLILCK